MDDAALLDELYERIIGGDVDGATAQVTAGLDAGVDPATLVFDAMIPALEEVGSLFETGVYFLPEMLVSAKAMQVSMDLLRPHLAGGERPTIGRYLIGTVAGDIHDIGKNMCGVMLEGAGFEVIDLGINVPGAEFVKAVREHRPDVVGMSAFLTTTLPEIERNVRLLEREGLRDSVKVMAGGAPVNERIAAEIGADAYAPDASAATRVARALLA